MTGVLLINIGTPDSPSPKDVGKYLKEFLMDPEVIDIPTLLRWLFVNLIIVPRRKYASSKLYEKIWTRGGSPLLLHSQKLTHKLAGILGNQFLVKCGMRYQKPSMETALKEFKKAGVSKIIGVPLYPQYSTSATRSSASHLAGLAHAILPEATLEIVPSFFATPEFIQSVAEIAKPPLEQKQYDHILFSYHGLPERHLKKLDTHGLCLKQVDCCDCLSDKNRHCYRAQCFETTRKLAGELNLTPDQYTICFQSRLGRTQWIRPFTDLLYESLPKEGKKRIAVLCPSFVADCLETLEEVQIRGKETFLKAGGEELDLIPCVNDSDRWVQGLARLIT